MIRNNLLSILIHAILGIIGFELVLLNMQGTAVLTLVVMFAAYVFAGKFFMKHQQNNIRNILSVSSVSVVLLIIAGWCSLVSLEPTQYTVWAFYVAANSPLAPIFLQLHSDRIFLLSAYALSFVPSLGFWMGLCLKNRKSKRIFF